jgi:hypothetical protein
MNIDQLLAHRQQQREQQISKLRSILAERPAAEKQEWAEIVILNFTRLVGMSKI